MLTSGSVRDYSLQKFQPHSLTSFHSLQDWRWKIRRWLNGDGDESDNPNDYWYNDSHFMSTIWLGNTPIGCAKTRGEDFVRVPPQRRSDDIITVLLGSRTPIVLRPQPRDAYLVIGACYHPDLSHGNALLGSDLKGWEPAWDSAFIMDAVYKKGHPIRRTDPGLDNIHPEDAYVQCMTEDGLPYFVQRDSPKQRHDPRMSEEGLKKRGVPVQRFRLL